MNMLSFRRLQAWDIRHLYWLMTVSSSQFCELIYRGQIIFPLIRQIWNFLKLHNIGSKTGASCKPVNHDTYIEQNSPSMYVFCFLYHHLEFISFIHSAVVYNVLNMYSAQGPVLATGRQLWSSLSYNLNTEILNNPI